MQKANLSLEARAVRAAYQKEWRRRHPGKEREYKQRYWERRAARLREQQEAREGLQDQA